MKHYTRRRDVLRGATALAAAALIGATPFSEALASAVDDRTSVDARTVQVLFGDLLTDLVAGSRTLTPDAIGRSAGILAKVASILELPMLFSVVPVKSGDAELLSTLKPFANAGNTIERTPVSPFGHPPTAAALARSKRKVLVIAGFKAEVLVLQTCLDAIAAGFQVFYVVDAIGGESERTETAAFREMDEAGAMPTSVLSFTTRLVKDFVSSPGSEVIVALEPLIEG